MRNQLAQQRCVGFVFVCLLVFSLSCGREPGIIVNIATWPDGVERIRVRTTIGDTVGTDIYVNKDQTRFVVRIPASSQGTVHLVAEGLDATDCKLVRGMLDEPVPDNLSRFVERTIDLSPLPARECIFGMAKSFPVTQSPSAVAAGDFNGDTKPDLVVASDVVNGFVSLRLGDGEGGFSTCMDCDIPVGTRPGAVAVGDFNGDMLPDVVVANYWDNNIGVLLNKGLGRLGLPTKYPSGGNLPTSIAVGDFDGDSKLDLAVTNSELAGNVSVLLAAGAVPGKFTNAQPFTVGRSPVSVAVGDFNGDKFMDLAVVNLHSKPGTEIYTVSILLNNSAGGFGSAIDFAVGKLPMSVAVGDFNGDRKADLVVANSMSNDVRVLFGGDFSVFSDFSVGGVNPQSVVVGDFNRDLIDDIAVANADSNDVSVLLGNGLGDFRAATNFPVGKRPVALIVVDLNLDKWTDLVIANHEGNSLSILMNQFYLTRP